MNDEAIKAAAKVLDAKFAGIFPGYTSRLLWQELAEAALTAAMPHLQGWQDIETAPDNEKCWFWLDWRDDVASRNQPLPHDDRRRLFLGKKRCWSSIYKGLLWQPFVKPAPPEADNA